jgi:hypothetical protein
MTQTQQFDADVAAVEPEGTIAFLFQGKPYIGQMPPIQSKLEMVEEGFELNTDVLMDVRLSQFVAPLRAPGETDVILIADVEYRVAGIAPDQYGIVSRYGLKQNT